MDDRELDEILEEIKNHALREKEEEKAAAAETIAADRPRERFNTINEVIKIVNEDENESPAPESEAAAETKEEEIPVKKEEASEESETDASTEDVVFTIPEESKETEEPQGDSSELKFTNGAEITAEDIVNETEKEDEPEETSDDYMSLPADIQDELLDDEYEEKKSKKPLIIILAIILVLAIGAGVYFGFFYKKPEAVTTTITKQPETTVSTTVAPSGPNNPLTGEANYNQSAIGKRPVAVVVENEYSTESVRPQWGLSEADIVLEGESEYSTRLLLFWADYTNMPEQIGPARSARPPFIHFSQLFDSVFIHAGLSKSKGNYVGANSVFVNENIDHINLLSYSEDGKFFGRDKSRTSTIEHTGYFNGTNAAELLEKAKINTKLDSSKFTQLEFNEVPQKLSDTAATSAKFIWSDVNSSGHCPKVGKFYYDESLEKYSTYDFDSDYGKANLEFENLIFLLDETEYVVKANYKGSGNSETYCNYKLSGGKGTILSHGTAVEIEWGVKDKKLWIKDLQGNTVKLNPGKSYIGYGSLNKGGSVTLNYDTAN